MTKNIGITIIKAFVWASVTFAACQYGNFHIHFARMIEQTTPVQLAGAVVISYLANAAVSHQLDKWED